MVHIEKLFEIISRKDPAETAYKVASKVFPHKSCNEIKEVVGILRQAWDAFEKRHEVSLNRGLVLERDALRRSFEGRVAALKAETSLRKKSEAEIAKLDSELKEVQKIRDALLVEINNLINSSASKSAPILKNKLAEIASLPTKPPVSRLAGWSIQINGGYYRAVRNAGGKSIGVHLGRELIISEALEKIRAKEKERQINPLPITSSDLAYGIIRSKKS